MQTPGLFGEQNLVKGNGNGMLIVDHVPYRQRSRMMMMMMMVALRSNFRSMGYGLWVYHLWLWRQDGKSGAGAHVILESLVYSV
jgi:hypothetical protein